MLTTWTDTPEGWTRNDALRALRVLLTKAGTFSTPMEGAWYRSIAVETALDVLHKPGTAGRHWNTHEACVSCSQTPMGLVARFIDRTLLALKAHPNHAGVLLLPERPLVLPPGGDHLDASLDAHAFNLWAGAPAPAILDPGWWEATPSPSDLIFPTRFGDVGFGDTAHMFSRRWKQIYPLLETAAKLEGFPLNLTLIGSAYGTQQSVWSFDPDAQALTPAKFRGRAHAGTPTPAVLNAFTIITEVTRNLFRGRTVLNQTWNLFAPGHHDPRTQCDLWTFSSGTGGHATGHETLRILAQMHQYAAHLLDAHAEPKAA